MRCTDLVAGGARGIGADIVRLAAKSGAQVVFGDLNEELATQLAAETGAIFLKSNAAKYSDNLDLFQEAYEKFGSVDHAVANAGIYEPQDAFDVTLDLESVKEVNSNSPGV
jgi:NAD(P)-dependent dehydrogenase (short-subunit alcohol dehydrogenase family)